MAAFGSDRTGHVKSTALDEPSLSCAARRWKARRSSPPCYVRYRDQGSSRTPSPTVPAAVPPRLYLREITAGMRLKIVFSFSAEFLKSSGHNDVRKKEARCHMFAWRRGRAAAGANGSQIACLSVGLARVWRRNYWSRAASSGAKWKRQLTASGRGVEPESRQWASAPLRRGNQICISEDRCGRRRAATLHNCKLSIHGCSSPTSVRRVSTGRRASRQLMFTLARWS